MTPTLDEDLVQHVNDLGASRWSGTAYRHTASNRDPMSGAGAKIFGGRWNPTEVGTVYLAIPVTTCLAELDRQAGSQNVTTADLLRAPKGRTLHTIAVRELDVLDLREQAARSRVGLDIDDISNDDWAACQAVGQCAYFLQYGGVLAPSASGSGLVLAAFESRVNPGQLHLEESEPLTKARYDALSEQVHKEHIDVDDDQNRQDDVRGRDDK